MRTFNTYGPADPAEHYHIPREPLLSQMVEQVALGKFFSIFAPRQTGKTTFMRDVMARLATMPGFHVVSLSFEGERRAKAERFYGGLQNDLNDQIRRRWPRFDLGFPPLKGYEDFREWQRALAKRHPDLRLVVLVDEFDGLATELVGNFLHILRQLYLTRQEQPNALHSVALISLRSVADLSLGSGSPFNIAHKITIPPFTLAEVTALLGQYTVESGQPFEPGVLAAIHARTAGHPFLVNRLAAILTSELGIAPPQPIATAHFGTAHKRLIGERNDNFSTLFHRADQHRDLVKQILFGPPIDFTLGDDALHHLYLDGVIRDYDGQCEIANSVYKQVLISRYRPPYSTANAEHIGNGVDFRRYVRDGELDMLAVLRDFAEFVRRRGQAVFGVTDEPREAIGQYLLLAYVDLLMRQTGGHSFVEVPTGPGRMDIVAVHAVQRYVIETKIWRGPAAFEAGQIQLAEYLKSEGLTEGYYVVFQARPDRYGRLPFSETVFDVAVSGCVVHIILVRLFPEPEA